MSHAFLPVLERGTRPLRDRGGLAATPIRAIMEPLDGEVFNRTGGDRSFAAGCAGRGSGRDPLNQ
jgi:hypothetical protein